MSRWRPAPQRTRCQRHRRPGPARLLLRWRQSWASAWHCAPASAAPPRTSPPSAALRCMCSRRQARACGACTCCTHQTLVSWHRPGKLVCSGPRQWPRESPKTRVKPNLPAAPRHYPHRERIAAVNGPVEDRPSPHMNLLPLAACEQGHRLRLCIASKNLRRVACIKAGREPESIPGLTLSAGITSPCAMISSVVPSTSSKGTKWPISLLLQSWNKSRWRTGSSVPSVQTQAEFRPSWLWHRLFNQAASLPLSQKHPSQHRVHRKPRKITHLRYVMLWNIEMLLSLF